jgi:hypothetical protein
MTETKYHTYAEPQENDTFVYPNFYVFLTQDDKAKGSGLNGSKHYPNLISS